MLAKKFGFEEIEQQEKLENKKISCKKLIEMIDAANNEKENVESVKKIVLKKLKGKKILEDSAGYLVSVLIKNVHLNTKEFQKEIIPIIKEIIKE